MATKKDADRQNKNSGKHNAVPNTPHEYSHSGGKDARKAKPKLMDEPEYIGLPEAKESRRKPDGKKGKGM